MEESQQRCKSTKNFIKVSFLMETEAEIDAAKESESRLIPEVNGNGSFGISPSLIILSAVIIATTGSGINS